MKKRQPQLNSSRYNAVINTLLTMAGIYVAVIVMMIYGGNDDIIGGFISSQATLEALYVNALAVISVTYSKFSTMDLIRVSTYFLSLFAIFIVVNIFVQSLYVVNPTLWSAWTWFRSPSITCILQIILALSIYRLECQEAVTYKKNKIR